MSLSLVRVDRIEPTPWKNGGGAARELLCWPDATGWVLRVSLAEVARDGSFSDYSGCERWFAVVSGAGVVLALRSGRALLEPGTPPLRFDGAEAPHCELLRGPTSDLNLIVRAEAGHGAMAIALPDEEHVSAAAWRGLYAADATRLQIDDTDAALAPAGTLLWSDHAARQRWRVEPADTSAARAWWLEFRPHEKGRR
jgi:environmental stress-induced protein Ves